MVDLPDPGARPLAVRMMRLALGPGLMILARIGGAVAGLVLTMLLTRSMGAAAAGEVATATALAMVLALFCSLNLEAGATRFMVQDIARGNFAAAAGYVRFGRVFVAVTGVAVTGLSLLALWLWQGEIAPVLLLAVLAAPLLGWQRFGAGLAMGLSRPILSVVPRTLLRPAIMAALAGLWIVLVGTPDPTLVMGMLVATTLATIALQGWFLQGDLSGLAARRGSALPDTTGWPGWVRIGLTLGLNVLFLEYSIYLTVLVAAAVLPSPEVAALDIALKIVALFRYALLALGQYYNPQMARAAAGPDRPGLERLIAVTGVMRLAVLAIGIALLLPGGPLLMGLFGAEFEAQSWLLWLLLLELAVIALFGPGTNLVGFSDRPHLLLPILFATLAVLVAGGLALGAAFGLAGLAWSVILSRLVWVAGGALAARAVFGVDATVLGLPAWLLARRRR